MILSNGDFIIITSDYANSSFRGYVGRYNSEGENIGFIGCFSNVLDYKDLVNDYFATQIHVE